MEVSSKLPRFCLGTYEGSIHGIGVAKRKKAKLAAAGKNSSPPVKLMSWFASMDHIGAVRTVASSQSGRWLVSGGSDETLRVYDMGRLVEYGTLHRHDAAITSLAFHADSHLLSGSEDGVIFIWVAKRWECLTSLKGHTGAVNGISVHQSGKVALTVGADNTLRMWNLVTGRHMLARQFKNGEPLQVHWSPVGATYSVLFRDRLMVCDQDGKVISQARQRDPANPLHCCVYVHEFLLAMGTESGQVLFWDLLNHRFVGRLQHGPSRVRSLEMIFGSDTSLDMLLSISTDGSIKIWNALKFLLPAEDALGAQQSRWFEEGVNEAAAADPDAPFVLTEALEEARARSLVDQERFGYTEYALPLNRAVCVCLLANNAYEDSGAAVAALYALAKADDEDVEQLRAEVNASGDAAAIEDHVAADGEQKDADPEQEIVDRKGKDIAQRRKQRKKKRDQVKLSKFQEEREQQAAAAADAEDSDDDGQDMQVVRGPDPKLRMPEAFSVDKRKKPVHKQPKSGPADDQHLTRKQRTALLKQGHAGKAQLAKVMGGPPPKRHAVAEAAAAVAAAPPKPPTRKRKQPERSTPSRKPGQPRPSRPGKRSTKTFTKKPRL